MPGSMTTRPFHKKPGRWVTARCVEVNGFQLSPPLDAMLNVPAKLKVAAAMKGWPSFSTARK